MKYEMSMEFCPPRIVSIGVVTAPFDLPRHSFIEMQRPRRLGDGATTGHARQCILAAPKVLVTVVAFIVHTDVFVIHAKH
jgi:hypothetical protein